MRNLSGHYGCGEIIRSELESAGIPILDSTSHHSEVPYTIIGQLGKITFSRAWIYWVADGNVPLETAYDLYANPTGRSDIRVNGSGLAPHPDEHVEWLMPDGTEVHPLDDKDDWLRLVDKFPELDKLVIFSNDPEEQGASPFITKYHIDSLAGLGIFADSVRSLAETPTAQA